MKKKEKKVKKGRKKKSRDIEKAVELIRGGIRPMGKVLLRG
jgi:hypothetical protein